MAARLGYVRKISGGKITIPPEVKQKLGWEEGINIEFIIEEGRLILQPYKKSCVFCNKDTEDVFWGKPLCIDCRLQIVQSTKYLTRRRG